MSPDIAARLSALEAACRRYHVRRLELFGSAAQGSDRPGTSDLDFLVEFERLPRGAYADSFFGLQETLEALFGRPIDLVVASAIKNPYFRESIESSKTPVYAASGLKRQPFDIFARGESFAPTTPAIARA